MPSNFYCPFCKIVYVFSDNVPGIYHALYQDTKIECCGIRGIEMKLCQTHEHLKKIEFEEKLNETIEMLYNVAEMFSVTIDELNEFRPATEIQKNALSRLWKFVRIYKPLKIRDE